ncbi:hypothetical protein ACLSU7_14570 [Bdellovibrio sp. HCB185ZH]|uniref:hypothetical protein n=1 Tax=Bdellovibrio sp. HCB185ZH TaxID=3394235 RepID=UPI0039A6830B
MKKFFAMFVTLMMSVSAFAGNWKLVATENIFPNAPQMKIYPVKSKEAYSQILVRVNRGTVRIQNPLIWLKNKGQVSAFTIQGDYRGPRDASANFLADSVRDIRMNVINLDRNMPAQFQIYLR